MYVELLSAALAGSEDRAMNMEDTRSSAAMCRTRMLDSRNRRDRSAEREIASEVDYDRSLIRLCTALGIDAHPESFTQPAPARARLEDALVEAGEDLAIGDSDSSNRSSYN